MSTTKTFKKREKTMKGNKTTCPTTQKHSGLMTIIKKITASVQ
jgi:hypothetical protein